MALGQLRSHLSGRKAHCCSCLLIAGKGPETQLKMEKGAVQRPQPLIDGLVSLPGAPRSRLIHAGQGEGGHFQQCPGLAGCEGLGV